METFKVKLSDKEKIVADYRKYFSTDEVKADLKGKTIRGGFVTVSGQIVMQVLRIGSTAILARILTPKDYGLIAMVTVVTGFVTLFKDLGLSMATIQREEVDQDQASTLFWINVAMGFAVFLITCFLALPIAWFYGESRLTWITIGLSVGFIFSGFTVQHQAILKRQMRFSSLMAINIISFLAGSSAGIVAALMGMRYWALVIMQCSIAFCSLVCTFILCPWIPRLKINLRKVDSMIRFGLNLTGFSIVNYFARNADNLLIGKIFGAQPLGFYTKAYSLLLLPLRRINNPMSSVAIPALSRLRESPDLYRHYYLRMIEKIALITMPLIVFLMVNSEKVVLLVLGPQWIEAARIFAVLGAVGLVQPVAHTTGWLFISQDRTKEQFRWGIIGSTLTVLSFIIGLPWGVFGVAACYSLMGLFITTPLLLWFVGRDGPVKTIDFYSALVFPASISLIFFLVLISIGKFFKIDNALLSILLSFFAGLSVCILVSLFLPVGRAALKDFGSILKSLYHR